MDVRRQDAVTVGQARTSREQMMKALRALDAAPKKSLRLQSLR
jgi:hypothetical protein